MGPSDGRPGALAFVNGHRECLGCGTCKMQAVLDAEATAAPWPSSAKARAIATRALYADVTFAKLALVAHCERDGVPFVPWRDFDDVRPGSRATASSGPVSIRDDAPAGPWPDRHAAIDLPAGYTARPSTPGRPRGDLPPGRRLPSARRRSRDVALSDIAADWDRPDFDLETMSLSVWHGNELAASGDVFMGRAEVDVAPAHRRPRARVGDACPGRGPSPAPTAATRSARPSRTVAPTPPSSSGPTATRWGTRRGRSGSTSATSRRPRPRCRQGLAFRDYRPGEDDRRSFEVIDAAFDEWQGRESHGFDNWAPAFLHRDEVVPELVPLVVEGDRIVGVALNYRLRLGDDTEGWTQQLAVDSRLPGPGARAGAAAGELPSVPRGWVTAAAACRPTRGPARSGCTSTSACRCARASLATRSGSTSPERARPSRAVAEGFEPSRELPPYTLSRRVPSAARAGHRRRV